jgi:hypothetical protein
VGEFRYGHFHNLVGEEPAPIYSAPLYVRYSFFKEHGIDWREEE